MPWALPEDEALDIERDASVGLLLGQRRVVAKGNPDAAVPLAQPVPIDLDSQVTAGRSDRDHLSPVRADGVVARVPAAAVLLGIPLRTIGRLHTVAVQRDSIDLDEGRGRLAGHVRDRARRGEGAFLRDASRGRVRLVTTAVDGLGRIGGSQDISDRHEVRGAGDVRDLALDHVAGRR